MGPRGIRNRPKIGHGTILGHPGLPKELPRKIRSVPGAPWEYPESVPERAESPQGRPGMLERTPPNCRKTFRSGQNRHQVAPRHENIKFLLRSSLTQRCRSNLSTSFCNFCFCCQMGEPSEVLRLPAKTEVWPFAKQVDSLTRRISKKSQKLISQSTRNR